MLSQLVMTNQIADYRCQMSDEKTLKLHHLQSVICYLLPDFVGATCGRPSVFQYPLRESTALPYKTKHKTTLNVSQPFSDEKGGKANGFDGKRDPISVLQSKTP